MESYESKCAELEAKVRLLEAEKNNDYTGGNTSSSSSFSAKSSSRGLQKIDWTATLRKERQERELMPPPKLNRQQLEGLKRRRSLSLSFQSGGSGGDRRGGLLIRGGSVSDISDGEENATGSEKNKRRRLNVPGEQTLGGTSFSSVFCKTSLFFSTLQFKFILIHE